MATSRTRLHRSAAWLLALDGLSDAADAQVLFTAHAARAGTNLNTGRNAGMEREICALVENLPLALALAATWASALPLGHLAASLRNHPTLLRAPRPDAPERHHHLEAGLALLDAEADNVHAAHSWGSNVKPTPKRPMP